LDILLKKQNERAFYSNLQLCGSVWDCPVCAARISEKRREEVLKAMRKLKAGWKYFATEAIPIFGPAPELVGPAMPEAVLKKRIKTKLCKDMPHRHNYSYIKVEREGSGDVLMLTLTFPHYNFNDIAELMPALRKAMTHFSGGRRYQAFTDNFGVIGTIRALEVTHGENGWHPHFHILILLDPIDNCLMFRDLATEYYKPYVRKLLEQGYSEEHAAMQVAGDKAIALEIRAAIRQVVQASIQKVLYSQWIASCAIAKLPKPTPEHGVHIQEADKAEAYISKFGLEPSERTKAEYESGKGWDTSRELVNANSKRGVGNDKKKGLTPFDLLRLSAGLATSAQYPPDRAAALFRAYSSAFFGFSQLFWSPGLKAKFGIDDVSDKAAAKLEAKDAELFCSITHEEWSALLSSGIHARAELLKLAEVAGVEAVEGKLKLLLKQAQARLEAKQKDARIYKSKK
jgi:hypothetical protein